MALAHVPTAPTPDADLERLVDSLARPDVRLTETMLDALFDRVTASGGPELAGRLILTIHGRGELKRARTLAARSVQQFPDDSDLIRIKNLIGPPRVVPTPPHTRIDRRPDFKWLSEHGAKYPGEWLVLSGGRLWAHAPNLREAEEQAKVAGLTERPLLHYVDVG